MNRVQTMPEQARLHGGWRVSPVRRVVGWGIAAAVVAVAIGAVIAASKKAN